MAGQSGFALANEAREPDMMADLAQAATVSGKLRLDSTSDRHDRLLLLRTRRHQGGIRDLLTRWRARLMLERSRPLVTCMTGTDGETSELTRR